MTDKDKNTPSHCKAYAAGYYKGLEIAGADANSFPLKEANMKASRITSKLASASSSERKIYDVIPGLEEWTIDQIGREFERVSGLTMQKHSLEKCIKNLCDLGVVKKVGHFKYKRAMQKTQEPSKVDNHLKLVSPKVDQEADPVQLLEELSEALLALASHVEIVTQLVAKSLSTKDEKSQKLEKLAEALKGLSE